jgi:hypothetical protein
VRELRQMLELRHASATRRWSTTASTVSRPAPREAAHRAPSDEWEPPILKVIAAAIRAGPGDGGHRRHREFLERTGQRAERERARARMQFLALLRRPAPPVRSRPARGARRAGWTRSRLSIARREADPYALAETLARQLAT